jgi:hypothetical protein
VYARVYERLRLYCVSQKKKKRLLIKRKEEEKRERTPRKGVTFDYITRWCLQAYTVVLSSVRNAMLIEFGSYDNFFDADFTTVSLTVQSTCNSSIVKQNNLQ